MSTSTSRGSLYETARAHARCFFTDAEWQTVEAMTARILPTTTTPGAREAGAVCFIDRMLSSHYSNFQALYREGLRRLDALAAEQFGRGFEHLNESEQDHILSLLEAGSAPGWIEAAAFFELVRLHTIEGVLSDPRYGGNRNAIGWTGLL